MSVILYTWELGGGLGHLAQFLPLAEKLIGEGHELHLAVKDIDTAVRFFGRFNVRYHQAPWKRLPARAPKDPARTFAHILHNIGWELPEELSAMAGAWRHLMESIRPDIILLDHSPTALLAAQSIACPKMAISTGFCHPPVISPLPDLRHWLPSEADRLPEDEHVLLETINGYLKSISQRPLGCVTELFGNVDATYLATFRELDPYRDHRKEAVYHGVWRFPGGDAPDWPSGADGKRIVGYLKNFPHVGFLLETLGRSGIPTVIFGDSIPKPIRQRTASPTLRFADRPVDLKLACSQADMIIHHAGHATTATSLLAGTPGLLLPFHLEQTLTAISVEKQGAAGIASPMRRDQLAANLHSVLNESSYLRAAQSFAEKYRDHDPEREVEQCAEKIGRLLGK